VTQPSEATHTRRSVLRSGVVIGGVAVWSIPTVTSMSGKAFAASPASSPPSVLGEHFTHVRPLGSTRTVPARPQVLGESSSSPGVLPFTGIGFPVKDAVELGAAAVATGAAITVAARRRQDADHG
jgi:hypothetical protein